MNQSEQLKTGLKELVVFYHQVGTGHTHLMLHGVVKSDRCPIIVVSSPGKIRTLGIPALGTRTITLKSVMDGGLRGMSGPLAWEHTALQDVLRMCLGRISDLEAELKDAQSKAPD